MNVTKPTDGVWCPDKSPDRIAGMFDAIAPRYDFLNHLLSAGIDRRWRAAAIRSLQLTGRETVLDICCGTADVALAAMMNLQRGKGRSAPLTSGAARVIGVDFSGAMLALGREKVKAAGAATRIMLVRGDAMRAPVRDRSFDALTVAFGLRNVQQPEVACFEMARVLRPGGRLAILEFGVPRIPGFRPLYLWYFRRVLPMVGRVISGHNAAYSYLPASVGTFASPPELVATLRRGGFTDIRANPLTLGIVYLYTAQRAG